jgi:hypothetical protein
MNTIAANTDHKTFQQANTTTTKTTNNNGLVQRYLAFCDDQMKNRLTWFLFPALILPCLFMPLAIFVMLTFVGTGTAFSIYLLGSMSLFIAGMTANVGNQTTRVTVSLFFAGAIWNILFPLLSVFMIG